MKHLPVLTVSGLTLVAMTFSSCETPGRGAGVGAATGAVIGAIAGGNLRSAAIGAAAGAATGAVIGKIAQDERRAAYGGYYEDRAYGAGYPHRWHYRFGRRTDHYGLVRSPYAPYALVDVRGLPHGARVIDPVSDRIFINP